MMPLMMCTKAGAAFEAAWVRKSQAWMALGKAAPKSPRNVGGSCGSRGVL